MNTSPSLNKKDIVSVLMMVFCLLMIRLFPEENYFQKIIISLVFLLVIPVLYIKIVLKESLRNFGLRIGNWKQGIAWIMLSLVGSFFIIFLLYQYAGMAEKYHVPQNIIQNFGLFVFYESVLVSFFIALYEFFFRGFVMFSFSEKLGYWAVISQFALFILFLIIMKDFNWTFAPYLISAFFAGVIAYKSRSLFYSYLFSLLFVIISDAVYIYSLINS